MGRGKWRGLEKAKQNPHSTQHSGGIFGSINKWKVSISLRFNNSQDWQYINSIWRWVQIKSQHKAQWGFGVQCDSTTVHLWNRNLGQEAQHNFRKELLCWWMRLSKWSYIWFFIKERKSKNKMCSLTLLVYTYGWPEKQWLITGPKLTG